MATISLQGAPARVQVSLIKLGYRGYGDHIMSTGWPHCHNPTYAQPSLNRNINLNARLLQEALGLSKWTNVQTNFPRVFPLHTHCSRYNVSCAPTSSAAVHVPIDDSQSLLLLEGNSSYLLWNKVTNNSTGLISNVNIQLIQLLSLSSFEKSQCTILDHRLGTGVDFFYV